jgi:uncharacterized protein YutE (UPF0331/DUF86 family)
MIDKSTKNRKIELLMKNLAYLHSLSLLKKEEFIENFEKILATRHAVQETIQICLDLAFHVCAVNNLNTPKNYRNAFQILGKAGFISIRTAQKMELWAGLRNLITHIYEDIDDNLLWQSIESDLDAIEDFIKQINQLKEK